MELYELIALKAEYEKELVLAQAKIAVISDIIAKAEAKEQNTEESEVAELETPNTEISY